jgi:hypothetical protein
MNKLFISDAAYRAIQMAAKGEMEPGKKLPGGRWEIEVDDEVLAKIERTRFVGETSSDVLLRMASLYKNGGLN